MQGVDCECDAARLNGRHVRGVGHRHGAGVGTNLMMASAAAAGSSIGTQVLAPGTETSVARGNSDAILRVRGPVRSRRRWRRSCVGRSPIEAVTEAGFGRVGGGRDSTPPPSSAHPVGTGRSCHSSSGRDGPLARAPDDQWLATAGAVHRPCRWRPPWHLPRQAVRGSRAAAEPARLPIGPFPWTAATDALPAGGRS
jgi:hypothetical protein